ncbi:MAG: dienelactone hydrolase [Burkholderiales bacterium]|nr:dienelactone hydrolase [Burkholderiales bacterium]
MGACVLAITGAIAQTAWSATLGQTALPARGEDGPVTVYYPSEAQEQPVRRGRMTLRLAVDAPVQRGNGRLVVISHGSGGSPWVHSDLARALVEEGYVVAMPEHRADNYRDDSTPGPESWARRPAEVSRAIDAIGRDPRFAPLLQLDRVGVYGMSAGGHTALTLAGGRWSPAGFARHCTAHIAEDFPACVGLFTHLTGGPLDGFKQWLAVKVIASRFDDDRPHEHFDPRVAAVVAAVPLAADYDLSSLAAPRVPLALVLAEKDRWLATRFHGGAVRSACRSCELIADMPDAGHGSMLSPLPPGIDGIAGELLNDPPGFDRSRMPEVDRRIAAFFVRYVPGVVGAPAAKAASADTAH